MEGVGRPEGDGAGGRCGYQGAPGAFSHEACIDLRPWDEPVAFDTFEAVIDALKAGESSARLFGLLAWYESPFYSAKERAALALTEAATKFGPHGVPDEVFEGARIEFDDRELTYVVAAIGLINMWNRFGVTFQLSPPSAAALTAEP